MQELPHIMRTVVRKLDGLFAEERPDFLYRDLGVIDRIDQITEDGLFLHVRRLFDNAQTGFQIPAADLPYILGNLGLKSPEELPGKGIYLYCELCMIYGITPLALN